MNSSSLKNVNRARTESRSFKASWIDLVFPGHSFRIALCISALLAVLFVAGCGGSGSKPISVSVTASATTVDGSNSITVTASLANDAHGSGVLWTLTGAGALSSKTSTSVVYTAPAATASANSATITATSIADSSQSSTVKITIPAQPSITTTSLGGGSVGTSYSVQLAAGGGISPYTWQLKSGTLPPCLTLSAAGLLASSSGLLATCAGTTELTFQVTDSGKPNALSATASMSLVVTPAPAITFTGTMPIVATNGTQYSGSAAASGGAGALTYTLLSGTLPSGLALFGSTGAVAGTPVGLGKSDFSIKAADAYGDFQSKEYEITVNTALDLNAVNLPLTGSTNVAYSGTILASGGSGQYTFQMFGLPANGLSGSATESTLTISGTPTSAETVGFSVQVSDPVTQATTMRGYSIVISAPTPVTLPTPSPSSFPDATVGQAYSASLSASGGVGPYTWAINGAAVTGAGLVLSNGLSATNGGDHTLYISGTPATTNSVVLTNVKVTDSLGSSATQGYSITVQPAAADIAGAISLSRYCGGAITELPAVTLTLGTTPPMQTSSDSGGHFSFSNVPDGTYTLTPSIPGPPDGPTSVFNPTSRQVKVVSGKSDPVEFSMLLGYTVSGNVAYSGAVTGQTYVNVVSSPCNQALGTSLNQAALASGGKFTIHGVPPGTYTVQAWMDPSTLGNGVPNAGDPSGKSASFTLSTANVTGQSVTMTDPTVAVRTSPPVLAALNPTNTGAIIVFEGNTVLDMKTFEEAFSSYTVQWSTDSAFSGTPASAQLKAVGTSHPWWILNNGNSGMNGTLTPGTAYYFRVRGHNAAGDSDWAYFGGPYYVCSSPACAVTRTIGEPSNSDYATVTGHVTITSEMTSNPTGPLYVGWYDPAGKVAYGYAIASPVVGDNNFSVSVLKSPTAGYLPFAILDQNKDGVFDAGDINNLSDNPTPVTINSDMTGMNELSYLYVWPRIFTNFFHSTSSNGGSPTSLDGYDLRFTVTPVNKLPVALQMVSGPNVITPADISSYCVISGCQEAQFAQNVFLGGGTPAAGDLYKFLITFNDGTTMDEYAQVQGWNNSAAVATVNDVPTNLAPVGSVPGMVQPNFSWTWPSKTANVEWGFFLCCGPMGGIWTIPDFTVTQIPGTLTWGIDPTNGKNVPNPSSLTTGTYYFWQITGLDDYGNSVVSQTSFTP